MTGITKRLLDHWQEPDERQDRQFFFCQLEAIETMIWLTEAPAAEKVGIVIPSDGGDFIRWCCKMATGSGKTIVMAMAIAWHILNKVTNRQDARFAKNVLIVAPGLTVKSRLCVLNPFDENNYYVYGLQKYHCKSNNQGGLIWAIRNAKKGTTLYEFVVSAYGNSIAIGGPLMMFLAMYPKAAEGFEKLKKDIKDRFCPNNSEEEKSELFLSGNFDKEVERWRKKNNKH